MILGLLCSANKTWSHKSSNNKLILQPRQSCMFKKKKKSQSFWATKIVTIPWHFCLASLQLCIRSVWITSRWFQCEKMSILFYFKWMKTSTAARRDAHFISFFLSFQLHKIFSRKVAETKNHRDSSLKSCFDMVSFVNDKNKGWTFMVKCTR